MSRAAPRDARSGRTWPERLAIASTITAAVLAFAAAVGLTISYAILADRSTVQISSGQDRVTDGFNTDGAAAEQPDGAPVITAGEGTVPGPETTPPPTFPDADTGAQNFLITGADNGACIDPDSPYAGAFNNRDGLGERSDTIMMFRVDAATSRLAVLSFPRDLFVRIAGSGSLARINSAYRRDDPQRLIDTIADNFGIFTDHFIQVDFCAFKTLVDAVGGVAVPFAYPARDPNTGLNVPTTGCFRFDGEHALAYVRSRKYDYEDPPGSGDWERDGTSDLGRISRQQDFLRRVLSSVLARGPLNPAVAGGLIEAAQNYIVTDDELSPARLLEFAGVLNNVAPGGIPSYQIETSGRTVNGAQILDPEIEGENMQEVLRLFRGELSLDAAPQQVFDTPPTTDDAPVTTTDGTTPVSTGTTTPAQGETVTTLAPDPDAPDEINLGIFPPRNVACD